MFILFKFYYRGHNVTFLNGFPADFTFNGLQEVTPSGLVEYIRNYTNWDLLGARMRGDPPLSIWDVFRFPWQVSDSLKRLTVHITQIIFLASQHLTSKQASDCSYPTCYLLKYWSFSLNIPNYKATKE